MKKNYLYLLVCFATLLMDTACSDDDTPISEFVSQVQVTDGTVVKNTLTFKLVPVGVTACAYAYYAEGENIGTPEDVLTKGTAVDPSQPSIITIEELQWNTPYTLVAASSNKKGEVNSTKINFVIESNPNKHWESGANTYIIPANADYSFSTQKVNGATIEGITKVDWIWATKSEGESQNLITNLNYSNGIVSFSSTGKLGNLLLGAFDSEGKIVWSWLIWCTDGEPKTIAHENGVRFMDRYIGALSADRKNGGTSTWGLMYQWGRKEPFYAGTIDERNGTAFTGALTETIVNPAVSMNWNVVPEYANEATATANPMNFYAQNKNWTSSVVGSDVNSLWSEKKTDSDPCPEGYRVPSSKQLSSLSKLRYDGKFSGWNYSFGGFIDWWPGHGTREWDKGLLVLSSEIFAWSCTTYSYEDDILVYGIATISGYVSTDAIRFRGDAEVVRCVAIDE